MKIAVLVKRVPDTASAFELNAAGTGIVTDRLKYIMSPYDEHAVQEAINLQAATGATVVAVSLGDEGAKDILRTALAMGADSAVLVRGEGVDALGPRGISEAIAATLRRIEPDLVFAGRQAVDGDGAQIPERVAELLGWPHASSITRFTLDGATASVDREVEGGHFVLELPLPAVFTTEKGINKPEYPKLPNIMKAKKKPLEEWTLADLGLSPGELAGRVAVESMRLPRQERLGRMMAGDAPAQVAALVHALRDDEKVL
ncbi:MAG: electron transfer flavoprotein subunit beta/FixA family protein [Candidatus Hydrogenedentes bacterium]|nr:electron transfer flavoprotein subunit beta/FixA family protein [Candidatus Hydrogenedentota bacterium]